MPLFGINFAFSTYMKLLMIFSLFFSFQISAMDCFVALAVTLGNKTTYNSREGHKRMIVDDAVFQEINGEWVRVGDGYFRDGRVHEDIYEKFREATAHKAVKKGALSEEGKQLDQWLPKIVKVEEYETELTVVHQGPVYFRNIQGEREGIIYNLNIGGEVDIKFYIPKGHEERAMKLIDLYKKLPKFEIDRFGYIFMNIEESLLDTAEREVYGSYRGEGRIDMFPAILKHLETSPEKVLNNMRHEYGHGLANALFKSLDPDESYIIRAKRDFMSVNEYGDTSWKEDFAEAVESYLRTEGGRLDPAERKRLKNRYEYLDEVFSQFSLE